MESKIKTLPLKWIILAYFALFFTSFIFTILGIIARGDPTKLVASWNIFADIGIFAITVYAIGTLIAVIILLFLIKRNGFSFDRIGFRKNLKITSIIYAILGVVIIYLISIIVEAIMKVSYEPIKFNSILDIGLMTISPLIGAICEEIMFRGYILTALLENMKNKLLAIIIANLIFASIHIYFGIAGIVFAFFAGLVFSFIYLKTNSIYPSIITHSIYNLIAVFNP